MRPRIALASLCLIGGAALTIPACSDGRAQTPTGGASGPPAVPITTATVAAQPMPLTLGAIGTAEAYTSVAIRAQITGALTKVHFTEGDEVQAGQTLFTLDRRPLEAALAQAQANLKRDTAQAANAQASAARYQDLQARGISTREQADTSRAAAAALDATLQADRAAVDNATIQLDYATITAPISGRAGALMVHEGNLVRANDSTPLVVINQVSPINVSFGLPESRLADIQRQMRGGAIRVEAMPTGDATPAIGRLSFIDNAVDAGTGQIKVKAVFPNADHRLWPGQFANVTVTLRTESRAIVVPTAAVQNGQQGPYVFLVKPDQTVEMRTVAIQRQAAELTIVGDGVQPGDVVVTDGHVRLVPGARVSVKPAAAQVAEGGAQ